MVAVAVTNATPLPPSPSPPPSDFSEIEARWAVGQTEVSTCLLHVTCSSFYRTTRRTENKNDKSSREIYTYTHIFTALPPSPSFHHPHINQPTHLPNMHVPCTMYLNLSDPLSQQEIHSGQSLRESKTPAWPVTRLAGRRRGGGGEASGFATAMDSRSLAGAEKTRRLRRWRSRRGQEEGGVGGIARDDDLSVLRPRKEMRYYFTGKSG